MQTLVSRSCVSSIAVTFIFHRLLLFKIFSNSAITTVNFYSFSALYNKDNVAAVV